MTPASGAISKGGRVLSLVFVALAATVGSTLSAAEPRPLPIADWQRQIRANFFIPDPLPALAAETHRRFQPASGVRAEAVTYGSQFGLRVPAILYMPDPLPKTGNGKIPGLVIVNGHGGDKYSWYAFYAGILYARAGMAVLTFDPLGEGERNATHESGTRAHDKVMGDEQIARREGGVLMTDVMQAVSYLSARPEVDPRRLAAAGYSLGSFILSVVGAIETRLKACVLVGGGNLDGTEGYWDKAMPMCQGLPYRSLAFLGDRPAVLYAMHAARGPTLVFNGAGDTVVAIPRHGQPFFDALRARVVALRGSEAGVFTSIIVPVVSHRPHFLTRPVVQWLEQQIDLPNWSMSDIDALSEIRIGDWAARYAVPMDKLYSRDEREGGTPALLGNVPGYQRDDLNVLPLAEWERQKPRFLLESWVARAEEAARSTRVP